MDSLVRIGLALFRLIIELDKLCSLVDPASCRRYRVSALFWHEAAPLQRCRLEIEQSAQVMIHRTSG